MNASHSFAERPAAAPAGKPSLAGATRAELAEALRSLGLAEREINMRAAQLWHWIYFRGAGDFDKMLNIAKPHARRCSPNASRWSAPESSPSRCPATARASGCSGWRRPARHDKGAEIECVYIPERRPRHALRLVARSAAR